MPDKVILSLTYSSILNRQNFATLSIFHCLISELAYAEYLL